MKKHRIKIVQVFRVEREIILEVDGVDIEDAIERQDDEDAPDFGDPRWEAQWSLENEEIGPAT